MAASHGGEPLATTSREQQESKERQAPNALIVHEAIRREGEEELRRPPAALAWSGLAAGLSMGFSLAAEGLLRAHLPDAPWRPLASKLGYSVGFLIVILGRQQLFTENTLTPILPLLTRRDLATFLRVLRLWIIVLFANLVGTFIFAWVVSSTAVFTPEVKEAFAAIGHEALVGSFLTVFLRGIFAGWLIALMVWLLPVAESARVGVIVIITFLVGIGGLAHSIAGSVETLFLVSRGEATWGNYGGDFLLPTLLGNIIGGVALVAVLNYAQVTAGHADGEA